jgi:hypothetical protein
MARTIKASGLRRMGVVLLVLMFACRSVGARAQDGTPSIAPLPDAPMVAAPASGTTNQELLERLLKMEGRHDQATKQMEDRLDQLTKQNEQLSREVRELRSANRGRNAEVDAPVDAMQPNTNEGGSVNRGRTGGMPPATSGGGPTTRPICSTATSTIASATDSSSGSAAPRLRSTTSGTGYTSGKRSRPSGRRSHRTSGEIAASDLRAGGAFLITGWNMPSVPSTGSGMGSRPSAVTRTSWRSLISSRSSRIRIPFYEIYKWGALLTPASRTILSPRPS